MTYDKVSKDLSKKELDDITKAIEKIDEVISSFAVNLSPEESSSLVKIGPLNVSFVERSYQYTLELQNLLPPYFDVQEFKRDWDLYNHLKTVIRLLDPVMQKIHETCVAAGSEALAGARSFYRLVKEGNNNNTPGLDVVEAELKKLYRKPRKKKKKKEDTKSEKNTTR
jgi:hypothetical protein